MDFCPEVLEGGIFRQAWLAESKGIACMTKKEKKDATEVDILELCTAIAEMLPNGERRPEECLSLKLASRLVHGAFILFDYKVKLILGKVLKVLYKFRVPKLPTPFDSMKKQGDFVSKKAVNKLSIEDVHVDQATQDDHANVVPLGSITLDEMPSNVINEVDQNISDLLNFGDIGYSMQPNSSLLEDVVFPLVEEVEPPEKPSATSDDVLTTPTNKRVPGDIIITPIKKRAVELATHLDELDRLLTELENSEIPWDDTLEFSMEDLKLRKNKKKTPRKPKSNRSITRPLLDAVPNITPEREELLQDYSHVLWDVPVDLSCMFGILFHEPHFEDHIDRKQQSSSHVESVTGQNFASRHTTLQIIGLPSIEEAPQEQSHQFMVSVELHAPHGAGTSISVLNEREELVESLATLLPAQTAFEVTLPKHGQMHEMSRRQRHQCIIDIVKSWNWEEKGKITLEDVCPRPLNRLNVAVTFGDLLSLCKDEYVLLIGNESTSELETIEKGRKLLSE